MNNLFPITAQLMTVGHHSVIVKFELVGEQVQENEYLELDLPQLKLLAHELSADPSRMNKISFPAYLGPERKSGYVQVAFVSVDLRQIYFTPALESTHTHLATCLSLNQTAIQNLLDEILPIEL